jgi:hypothetical protein
MDIELYATRTNQGKGGAKIPAQVISLLEDTLVRRAPRTKGSVGLPEI